MLQNLLITIAKLLIFPKQSDVTSILLKQVVKLNLIMIKKFRAASLKFSWKWLGLGRLGQAGRLQPIRFAARRQTNNFLGGSKPNLK